MKTNTTVQTFNDLIALLDDHSGFKYDRIDDPARLLKWWKARLGDNAVCVRSLEVCMRQLGYAA